MTRKNTTTKRQATTKNHQDQLNYPLIQKRMKVMAQKAIAIIRREWSDLVIEEKPSYNPNKDWDCATNGDKLAQAMYVREIRRLFPLFGAIAEETDLTIPCTHPKFDMYFTIDPLDGTKAYTRRQATGVGTMIALVKDGKVVATVIADVNSGETFSFAGEADDTPVEWFRFGATIPIEIRADRLLARQYVILREAPRKLPPVITKMIEDPKTGGLFKDLDVSGGSIGLSFARVWKGEVSAMVMAPSARTPWDETPLVGISQKLGFIFLKIDDIEKTVTEYTPQLIKEKGQRNYIDMVIHKTRRGELQEWLKGQGFEYKVQ